MQADARDSALLSQFVPTAGVDERHNLIKFYSF